MTEAIIKLSTMRPHKIRVSVKKEVYTVISIANHHALGVEIHTSRLTHASNCKILFLKLCRNILINHAEGEQSIHDSLEELADLLGDEEMTTETDKGLPLRQGQEGADNKPKSPNQKHRAGKGVGTIGSYKKAFVSLLKNKSLLFAF